MFRLACVPHIQLDAGRRAGGRSSKYIEEIDFISLLEHFQVKLKIFNVWIGDFIDRLSSGLTVAK